MATRTANAEWKGNLQQGQGTLALGSGAYQGAYSFKSRFEEGEGTNPEELIAAAHAGCFSMALAAGLSRDGYQPAQVATRARVHLEKVGDGFAITRIELETEARIPDIDDETLQNYAQSAKTNCPVSKALAGSEIQLKAKLGQ